MYHYCTYFDHHYLPRGLALYESLRAHAGAFRLWVLCMSTECREILGALRRPEITTISLEDFEQGDAELVAAKTNRSPIEYYFTCTPSLPLYVFEHWPEVELITYLDADLFFFSSPQPLYQELGDGAVLIVPHRFSPRDPASARRAQNGLYNVGWLSFRRNEHGLACLRWWRARCNEWCYDRLEDGRFADQKYLDSFPKLFSRVVVLHHPGANLAPWNIRNHTLSTLEGRILVDGQPLVFFHFHGFKNVAPGIYDPYPRGYGVFVTRLMRRHLLRPYIQTMKQVDQSYLGCQSVLSRGLRSGLAPPPLVGRFSLARGIARGRYVTSGEHKGRYYRLLFAIFWAYEELLAIYYSLRRRVGRWLRRWIPATRSTCPKHRC